MDDSSFQTKENCTLDVNVSGEALSKGSEENCDNFLIDLNDGWDFDGDTWKVKSIWRDDRGDSSSA